MLLLDPISIGTLTLRNRLVMPPMAVKKGENGTITQRVMDYYEQRVKDGVFGLVITEHCFVSASGQASPGQLSLSRDQDIEGLSKLVDMIHGYGMPVFAQINHAGGKSLLVEGQTTSPAPSAKDYVTTPGDAVVSHEMIQAEIDQVIGDFVAAALRAKQAGYDGVEIHSAHEYLLNEFYSPISNKRTDDYTGATLEGRIRLHRQIIRAIRKVVGDDYPLSLRLGALDYQEGSSTVEDALEACRQFEAEGINLLSISGGLCGYRKPGAKEEGYFGEESQAVKEAVSIPVLLTGGVRSEQGAENLLQEGKADLIGVGRPVFKSGLWAPEEFADLLP